MPRAPGRPPGIPGIPPGIPGGAPPGNERGSTGCLLGPGYMLPASSLLTTLHLHPVTQRSLLSKRFLSPRLEGSSLLSQEGSSLLSQEGS